MRKFSFNLESVRALRGHTETMAKEALAREIAAGTQREAELRGADAALASALAASSTDGAGTGAALLARQAYVERCEARRLEARDAVGAQQRLVEGRRVDLEAAAAGRAAVERLRERRLAAFVHEQLRTEAGELGELALSRVARGGRR